MLLVELYAENPDGLLQRRIAFAPVMRNSK
jgi:hypothetical protein